MERIDWQNFTSKKGSWINNSVIPNLLQYFGMMVIGCVFFPWNIPFGRVWWKGKFQHSLPAESTEIFSFFRQNDVTGVCGCACSSKGRPYHHTLQPRRCGGNFVNFCPPPLLCQKAAGAACSFVVIVQWATVNQHHSSRPQRLQGPNSGEFSKEEKSFCEQQY